MLANTCFFFCFVFFFSCCCFDHFCHSPSVHVMSACMECLMRGQQGQMAERVLGLKGSQKRCVTARCSHSRPADCDTQSTSHLPEPAKFGQRTIIPNTLLSKPSRVRVPCNTDCGLQTFTLIYCRRAEWKWET